MASSMIVGGIVMWVVDGVYGDRNQSGDVEDIRVSQAIWIGFCQTLARVFPGTSRSMPTIAAGQLAGLSRATALEFSFLLSIPTKTAATGYELWKFLRTPAERGLAEGIRVDAHGDMVLAIGLVVSFFVAWGVVAWLMNWVRSHGFAPFAIYRILAGIAVLVWALR
jgi:undecaprenyl-diphosphatase